MRERTYIRLAIAGLGVMSLGLLAAACSEPLVFPDWTVPVPEDTRIVEYADATREDREGNRIEVVEDLVIGARGDDDNYSLFMPSDVLTDSAGRIYVFDSGNARIQVFDEKGEYLRTLGRAGSGPGEFRGSQGGFITVLTVMAGDSLLAYDMSQSRVSMWRPDGVHDGDYAVTDVRLGTLLAGLDDGSFVAVTTQRGEDGSSRSAVVAFSADSQEQLDYVALPRPDNLTIGARRIVNPSGRPVFAATSTGTVYASAGDEYQVLASGPDGEAEWALRVARQRPPFTDGHRARIIEVLSENAPDLDAGGTTWPSHLGSVSRLAVDGHGHLYVFGTEAPFADTPEEVDVDVYAPDGQRLFTGTMPPVRWTDARDDFVYAIHTNEETEEREPARYRLVEPFGR